MYYFVEHRTYAFLGGKPKFAVHHMYARQEKTISIEMDESQLDGDSYTLPAIPYNN